MLQNDIYRIIDANVNRASEAMRVLEDYIRYSDFSAPCVSNEKLKNIRHKINSLFNPFTNLILNRESIHDIGRNIENKSKRDSTRDIIRANCKRVEESLRVLAEYGQLLNINTKELEEYRYEVYTIEKELIKNEKLIRLHNAKLYLITNRDYFKNDRDFFWTIEKSIEGSIDIIQLREKNEKGQKILELAKEIKNLIKNTDVLFIVNDRVDLALAADADGVHLGQDDMPLNEARKITPHGFIIGLSTHSVEQGLKGIKSSADYLGVGPVFPTPTKPDYKPAGLEYVKWAGENVKEKPFFAIGGIDESNIDKVLSSGAKKIAVVRAIMNSRDPLSSTKTLKEKILNKNNYVQTR